jgi:UDP-N-acetylmuramoyl-L-alanyl-D-glutamate--2,6-diaminopimelate ligase
MIKPLVKGKLIAVFGSAGERDVEKRPLQGQIASHYCDIIILTDEDPRLEDREKILCEIANGCTNHVLGKNLFMKPDRSEAISFAFDLASESDIVLLLGKGHEASIIYAEGPKTWDEIEVAGKILAVKGYKA